MACMHRTPEEKRALLDEWRASGLKATVFARERGINRSSLLNWVRGEVSERDGTRLPMFLHVEVTDPPPSLQFMVEVAGSGHRVAVPAGFNADELRRLVGALS